MHGINLKPAVTLPAASVVSKPPQINSVWRNKLEGEATQAASRVTRSDVVAKLLHRAKVINREQYCDALEIAESLNKSIDQVIATSFLNEHQTRLCTDAMSYLDRGIINDSLAADALWLANAKRLSFIDGLKYFGYGW